MGCKAYLKPVGEIVHRDEARSPHDDEWQGGVIGCFAVVGEETGFDLHGVADSDGGRFSLRLAG